MTRSPTPSPSRSPADSALPKLVFEVGPPMVAVATVLAAPDEVTGPAIT
jgi:hypothetical protein